MKDNEPTGLAAIIGDALRRGAEPAPQASQAIQNLVQVYAFFCDGGRTSDLAELFVVDALWDGSELGHGKAEGHEAIAAHVTGHVRPGEPMMHLPGPALLTAVSEDEVHAVCWCLATRWRGGQTRPPIHFYYEDTVRRCDDGRWRFQRRVLRAAFPA